MNQKIVTLEGLTDRQAMDLLGYQDGNLKTLCEYYEIEIVYRSEQFILMDCDEQKEQKIRKVLNALFGLVQKNLRIVQRDVVYACRQAEKNNEIKMDELFTKTVGRTLSGKVISPKTFGQLRFVEAMEKKDIVFAIGPAGTGKTYLAVIYAVTQLKKGNVKRIVLTRPAVEAGESLGFLPGDLKEKVDPYLRPLYDALYDALGQENTERYIEKGIIEIAPLAYMRGRTLEEAFVILDEAQNTTTSQMKMFLTRLGFNSKMVITGDITQIDLANGKKSGLEESAMILKGIKEIAVHQLSSDDVVRHPLVQKIIDCYAKKGV